MPVGRSVCLGGGVGVRDFAGCTGSAEVTQYAAAATATAGPPRSTYLGRRRSLSF